CGYPALGPPPAGGDEVFCPAVAGGPRPGPRPGVGAPHTAAHDRTVARTLPAARDRAAALLIVCGDPQTINSALGAGV
ncbi:hypothetical protein ACH5AP_15450, partial [Streptomyces anulatus]